MGIRPNSPASINSRPARFKLVSRNALFFWETEQEGGKRRLGSIRFQSRHNHCQISAGSTRFRCAKKGRDGARALSSYSVLDGEGGTEKSRVENRVTNCTSTKRVAVSTGCEQRVPVIQGVPAELRAFVTQDSLWNWGDNCSFYISVFFIIKKFFIVIKCVI